MSHGLDLQGIDLLLDGAAPELPEHETPLYLAMFEKAHLWSASGPACMDIGDETAL